MRLFGGNEAEMTGIIVAAGKFEESTMRTCPPATWIGVWASPGTFPEKMYLVWVD